MKKYGFTALAGLLMVLLIGLVPVLSQDGEQGEEGGDGLMEAWMKLQQSGPEHEWLAKDAGEWTVTQRVFMEGADEPFEVQGESTFTMKWGRFLYEETNIGGDDEANVVGFIGFDNSAGEFKALHVGIWLTGLNVSSGTRSEDGKTITLKNERVEKGLNNLKIVERAVITRKSDNERLVESFAIYGDAPERKTGELIYKRKK